jgi:broad-specificity NMP kinase
MQKIIAITGPTGSGKSTVAKLLCKKFDKCVRLDIDRVKHFVESGFVYDDTPEGKKQWALCVKNVIDLSKNFVNEGYNVIIEGYIDRESPGWPEVSVELPVDKAFLLLPNLAEIKKRNKSRDPKIFMEDIDVERHYEYFSQEKEDNFIVLDTSNQTPEETVKIILKK